MALSQAASGTDGMMRYDALVGEIIQAAQDKRTGTMFLVMPDNTGARVVFDGGEIVHVDCRLRKGEEALLLLRSIESCRVRFSPSATTATRDPSLPSTDVILSILAEAGGGVKNIAPNETPSRLDFKHAAKIVEAELIEAIGPFGGVLFKEHIRAVKVNDQQSLERLVNVLAKEIPYPDKRETFRKSVQVKLRNPA